MIKQKEMPTTGLVCTKRLDTEERHLEDPYHSEEGIFEVTLCEEGEEVGRDEHTERYRPSA